MALIDLTGKQFSKLRVVDRNEINSKSGNARWNCKCECGNSVVVIGSHLRSGHTSSCGCIQSEKAYGLSKTRIYTIWKGMHNRCYKKEHDAYKWYGQKGIKVCDEWHDLMSFFRWANANGYKDDLSIDRIDSNDDYKPSNCRWKSQKEQMNNVSSNKIITYRNKEYTQSEFADTFNLKYHTVRNRIRLGWGLEEIINTPEVGNLNE